MQDLKVGVMEYAQEAYVEMYNYAEKINAQSLVEREVNDAGMAKTIVDETVKMLSLTPESLAIKMGGMGQCLVDSGLIKAEEYDLVTEAMSCYANEDHEGTGAAFEKIISLKSPSEAMQRIGTRLAAAAPATGSGSLTKRDGKNWKRFTSIMEATGVLVGGFIGLLIGNMTGKALEGLQAGMAIGGKVMKAVASFIVGIFTKKKGFKAGPNGEDCTPPFLKFPIPTMDPRRM